MVQVTTAAIAARFAKTHVLIVDDDPSAKACQSPADQHWRDQCSGSERWHGRAGACPDNRARCGYPRLADAAPSGPQFHAARALTGHLSLSGRARDHADQPWGILQGQGSHLGRGQRVPAQTRFIEILVGSNGGGALQSAADDQEAGLLWPRAAHGKSIAATADGATPTRRCDAKRWRHPGGRRPRRPRHLLQRSAHRRH